MLRPEAGRAWGGNRGPRVSQGQAMGAMPRHTWAGPARLCNEAGKPWQQREPWSPRLY